MSSCPLFNSSRTQKIISLSSCEVELHAIVSPASDGKNIRSGLEFALGTEVDPYIFTDSSSARQRVMKGGFGKVRHLDGKLPWIQNRQDLNTVQVPTDGKMTDINTLGGQRTRFLMHLIGFWHSEEQTRVGELEGKAYEGKRTKQARSKIAKMIVRIVALEGLQPRVTEAFMRENEIKNGGA